MPSPSALLPVVLASGLWSAPPALDDPAFTALLTRTTRCDAKARAGTPCPVGPDIELICDVALRTYAGRMTALEGVYRIIAEVQTSTGVATFHRFGTSALEERHAVLRESARRGAGIEGYHCVGLDEALAGAATK